MTEGVIPDYQKDPNPYQNPGAGGPAEREAIALERIADTLDNIAALLASQRVPAGSAPVAAKKDEGGGWAEWGGGRPPVSSGILVDVMLRNGKSITAVAPDELAWWHDDDDRDIVAYRIHNPHRDGKAE